MTFYNFQNKGLEMSGGRRCGRDRLLEATQDGYLDQQTVVEMVARWLTTDEIYEMCDHNEINHARITCD